jgi:hypothetical protein
MVAETGHIDPVLIGPRATLGLVLSICSYAQNTTTPGSPGAAA